MNTEPATGLAVVRGQGTAPGEAISRAIVEFLGRLPHSHEHGSAHPDARARLVAAQAARRAALTAGGLALPPGPLGWVTVLPELVMVWKVQAQMVADIAGAYGQEATLTREHMVYCLFRHTAAQAVRDLAVRVGGRLLVRQTSLTALQRLATTIGVKLTQRAIGSGLSRWLPVAGALGVGAYAYVDTAKVAQAAIELFGQRPEPNASIDRRHHGSHDASETAAASVSRIDGHRAARGKR